MGIRSRSRWARLCAVLALVVLFVPLSLSAAQPAPQDPPRASIEPAVTRQLAEEGETTYWVVLKGQADLSGAYRLSDWKARGQYVYDQLTKYAATSQADLAAYLAKSGATFKQYWIVNAIQVTSGDALLNAVSRRPDVQEIAAPTTVAVPKPEPGVARSEVNGVEWNIDRVGAPQVWSTFGVKGEGIVIANIDSGVEYTHPALVSQYRGNLGGGAFDHNYNWHNPTGYCDPSAPCDNNGHGTHTMGTMVGDDGVDNQIGVAPGARWIAAKGCEENWCTDTSLLSAGQWVLAPTDLAGANARPDLRPHVVNNSWGGGQANFWYQPTVQAWVASGIFPAFSIGNSGSYCGSANSPGDYAESYASGAFDVNNSIAWFSSRGPAWDGSIKPNLASPGVDVRSSVPGAGYAWNSGTSMASPHTAAAVALMWSAAPALIGDIAATRALLDTTAVDTEDLTCGGEPANNNVWGEGRLDAYTAVGQSPRGPVGVLEGTVTDAMTGDPVAGAEVDVTGPLARYATTDASGFYRFPMLSIGSYALTVSKFAYVTQTIDGVMVSDGATTVQDVGLALSPAFAVSGSVRDQEGQPLANATVTILGTPLPAATTDAAGLYSFASVPEGSYEVTASAGRCNDPATQSLTVGVVVTDFDFTLPQRSDSFGYYCRVEPFEWIPAANDTGMYGDDTATEIPLPFPFTFYGYTYNTAWVSTNGFLNFLEWNPSLGGGSIPSVWAPNAAIYAFWDDLWVQPVYGLETSVRTELIGDAPNRKFVIEWRDVGFCCGYIPPDISFEVVLYENGQILMQYKNLDPDNRERGGSATVGIENESGTVAFQYLADEPALTNELAVRYVLPPSAFVQGTVTDANDGQPLDAVTVRAAQNGSVVRQVTTDATGFYRFMAPLGVYDLEASKTNYETQTARVELIVDGATYIRDFALRTPRGAVSPDALEFIVPTGESRTKSLTLSNTGSLDMSFEIKELGGGQVMMNAAVSQAALKADSDYAPNATTTKGIDAGLAAAAPAPEAVGDVLKSWTPDGVNLPWGVGFDGDVWVSDPWGSPVLRGKAFAEDGASLGVSYDCPFGSWCADMAYDAGRGWMCSVAVGGDNGIHCWDPASGAETGAITGAFSWISQRGLAYRPDDDSFYVGGWNENIVYHVAGFSHATPGVTLDQCYGPFGLSGLAWNPAHEILWAATNNYDDTIYELTPTCGILATLPHPNPYYNGGGLEMDYAGNLWMVSQGVNVGPRMVYLVESGVPNFVDVPWLSQAPASGTVAAGSSQSIRVTANATGLAAGIYEAMMVIRTNSAGLPDLTVPVRLIVPAYFRAVDAGGGPYVDKQGDTWSADQLYKSGSWGYVNKSSRTGSTKKSISGTEDDPLYQTFRQSPTEYKFDGLPAGMYEIDLRFAELQMKNSGTRLFDVIAELNNTLLPAHDIYYEVGAMAADNHTFLLKITDGQLNLRFVERRGYSPPIVNGIRIVHRPDIQ